MVLLGNCGIECPRPSATADRNRNYRWTDLWGDLLLLAELSACAASKKAALQLLPSKERSCGCGRGFDLEQLAPVEARVRACKTKENSKQIVTVFVRKRQKQVSQVPFSWLRSSDGVTYIRERWPTSYLNPVSCRKTISRFGKVLKDLQASRTIALLCCDEIDATLESSLLCTGLWPFPRGSSVPNGDAQTLAMFTKI